MINQNLVRYNPCFIIAMNMMMIITKPQYNALDVDPLAHYFHFHLNHHSLLSPPSASDNNVAHSLVMEKVCENPSLSE